MANKRRGAHHHHHHHHHYRDYGEPHGGTASPNPHRLYRSDVHRLLGGVCGGIAEYLGWRAWHVRIPFLILAFPFAQFWWMAIAYILAWWFIKPNPGHVYATADEEAFWRDVSTRPKVTISQMRHKFRGLEARAANIERTVISDEYRLKKAFRDIE